MNIHEKIPPKARKIVLFVYDSFMALYTIVLSFALFYSVPSLLSILKSHWWFFVLTLVIRLTGYYLFNLYGFLWRYASTREFVNIVKSVSLSSLVIVLIVFMSNNFPFYKRILLVDWAFNVLCIGTVRAGLKMYRNYIVAQKKLNQSQKKRVLIVGGGDAGVMVAREILLGTELNYKLIGFVDDKVAKIGQFIYQAPVLGSTDKLASLIETNKVDLVIIAIPSASGKTIRRILSLVEPTGIECKITPGLSDIVGGKVSISQLREVNIEDLLRRPVVTLDVNAISEYLTNKIVLVTGAGGSIGQELSRQIKRFSPKTLLLLDKDENAMYNIHMELSTDGSNDINLIPIVADIKNKARLKRYFELYRPETVFHAAAHKHVPLMERNVQEVIENNILGTRNLVELSDEFEAKEFVLISTDKAVNSTNAMGATKRMCEILVQAAANESKTRFSAVRFGNVLGSTGSVVPLFKKQILKGGPITVTHEEMTRFFMTIPEAVSLVIQTGALSKGGEIFILDMGEPVKIIDLARDLIRLSGLEEGKDIDIKVVGLRAGEKLYEELFFDKSLLTKTSHAKIFVTAPSTFNKGEINQEIDSLLSSCQSDSADNSRELLMQVSKRFSPKVGLV